MPTYRFAINVAGVLKRSLALGRHTVDVTNASMPCFKTESGCSISGAVPIARYLAETTQESKLKDGLDDVKVLQWMEWAQNNFRPSLITRRQRLTRWYSAANSCPTIKVQGRQ